MSGQSAALSIGKARAQAKGAGHDMGCGGGGTKASAPTEGHTIGGDSKGKSVASGTVSPKKGKHNY